MSQLTFRLRVLRDPFSEQHSATRLAVEPAIPSGQHVTGLGQVDWGLFDSALRRCITGRE